MIYTQANRLNLEANALLAVVVWDFQFTGNFTVKKKSNRAAQETAVSPPECLSAAPAPFFEKHSTTESIACVNKLKV